MVEAGAAVQEHERRLLAHERTVGHEPGALDVEEEPYPVDPHPHAITRVLVARAEYGTKADDAQPRVLGRHGENIMPGSGTSARPLPSGDQTMEKFRGVDYYGIEELYSEEERMIRDAVRNW